MFLGPIFLLYAYRIYIEHEPMLCFNVSVGPVIYQSSCDNYIFHQNEMG